MNRPDSGARVTGPDRHRAVEERRDLDASLQKLAEQDREQRHSRRRTPGGTPGLSRSPMRANVVDT